MCGESSTATTGWAKVEQSVRYPAIAATEVEDGRPGRQCGVDDLRLTSRRQ